MILSKLENPLGLSREVKCENKMNLKFSSQLTKHLKTFVENEI